MVKLEIGKTYKSSIYGYSDHKYHILDHKDGYYYYGTEDTVEGTTPVFSDNSDLAKSLSIIPDRPHMCYIIGGEDTPLEVDERFKIEAGFTFWVDNDGYVRWEQQSELNAATLCGVINHPEKIIRQPQFSEDEKALMRLYSATGYTMFSRLAGGALRAHGDRDSLNWLVLPEKLLPNLTYANSPFNAAEYLEGLK